MVTWLDGNAISNRGIGADISGNAILASLEGGYPIALGGGWTLEPQAQLIWQRIDLDNTRDPFSSIHYDDFDGITGRFGLRLESNMNLSGVQVQPFVDVNLWQNFSSNYSVIFNDRPLTTDVKGTSLEVGAGLSARVAANVSAFGAVRFSKGLDGDNKESFGGNIGLRVEW